MIKLSIVILSYNTKDLTINCIKSLVKNYGLYLQNGEIEIVIVDNASIDDSVEGIKYFLSTIGYDLTTKIIQNKENCGFAKGCNIGVKNSKGKYVLFLNSDTEVLDNGLIKMIDFLDNNSNVGILGGKILNSDGSSQPSCGKFYNLFNLFLSLIGAERFGMVRNSPNNIRRVDWVSGACMMARRDVFDKLKGFDEKLFMYIEDMEICYRVKKLGFSTYFYTDLRVVHKNLGSSNRNFAIAQIYKGILYFYSKHKSYGQYLFVKMLLYIKATVAIIIGILTINKDILKRYRQAIRF